MRTGIVGLGLRAGNVLKMIMEDMPEMELVGYVDPDPCGLSIIEEHSNSLTQYQTLDQMINESSLDLLWVASPNHLHLEHIRLGLEAGLKVFSEKPIVTTKEDSFALASLIKKFGENQLIVGLVLAAVLGVQLGKRWLKKWKSDTIRNGILVAIVASGVLYIREAAVALGWL